MSRKEATEILYMLINSTVLSDVINDRLSELANVICENSFTACEEDVDCSYGAPNYCEDCEFLAE